MSPSTPPEWTLVLAGARTALGEPASILSAATSSTVDWERVLEIARQNRLEPLLYRGVRRLPEGGVPSGALAALKEQYLANAARNALLLRALGRLLRALDAAGIPVIVLKGACLAELAYPERALRPMGDIDLLVREEHVDAVEPALRGIGYRITHDAPTREDLKVRHHHWIFQGDEPARGIPVEVHWSLHPPGTRFQAAIPAIWERAAPARLAGAPALVLSPEDLLLHLITHAARHRFNAGVLALCDLAAVIGSSGGSLNWTSLAPRANEWQSVAEAGVMLELARELLGAQIPEATLAALRAAGAEALDAALVRERILEEKGPLREAAEFQLRWMSRSWPERLAALRHVLASEVFRPSASPGHRSAARVPFVLGRYVRWTWSLVRSRRAVAAIVGREARKSALDSPARREVGNRPPSC